MNEAPGEIELLRMIRERGWLLAVHRDMLVGARGATRRVMSWLFIHPESGQYAAGDGMTDLAGLEKVWAKVEEVPVDPRMAPTPGGMR